MSLSSCSQRSEDLILVHFMTHGYTEKILFISKRENESTMKQNDLSVYDLRPIPHQNCQMYVFFANWDHVTDQIRISVFRIRFQNQVIFT
jgi:hypothetical protein